MSLVRFAFLSTTLVAAAFAAEAGTALKRENPFAPAPGSGAPAAPANETIEFAGVSLVTGRKPDLIFYDKTAKKSHWISEGETKEGIAVLKYDGRREIAVVKVNGTEKTLELRKGGKAGGAPAPVAAMPVGFNVPAPVAPAPLPTAAMAAAPTAPAPVAPLPTAPAQPATTPTTPATPETQAKAETEARMLVSDLLEIGMAQRKAYEEAQRRAAEGTPPPATQAPSQPPPTAPKQGN